MQQSFSSFGIGLVLAVVLVYLVLMAQFASFSDPFIILLAVPPASFGGIAVSFRYGNELERHVTDGYCDDSGHRGFEQHFDCRVHRYVAQAREGVSRNAFVEACKARLRPILMTSLATIFGLIPLALALEPGSEQYAPLARAILGGLTVSVIVTVFLVPAAYLLIHRKEEHTIAEGEA